MKRIGVIDWKIAPMGPKEREGFMAEWKCGLGLGCIQGLVQVYRDGRGYTGPCECQKIKDDELRLKRGCLPAGYENATLENFQETTGTREALFQARRFVEEFVPRLTKKAPLFQGTIGTGKTHLAVGIAKALAPKGIEVRFVDPRELMQRLRASYKDDAEETEDQIFKSIWKGDLVIIDDLGRHRMTEWSEDVLELLIGRLYNDPRALLVTTNFTNQAAGTFVSAERESVRQRTLGDQIGNRSWSRLQELCSPKLCLTGSDFRLRKETVVGRIQLRKSGGEI